MADLRIKCSYDPDRIPAQAAFRRSTADIIGYGGAMSGGKTRSICELALDWMLNHPSIEFPIVRQTHTSITDTTRKIFMEQVLPSELKGRKDLVRIVDSQGKDFVEFLWNGSKVNFIGLDNPGKLYSGEYGGAMFDEAHQISEHDVLEVNHRLRQRCPDCIENGVIQTETHPGCTHMPLKMIFAFNPASPNHWLNKWFRLGATPTEWGFTRDFIRPTDADEDSSIGTMDFYQALATDNPFVSKKYIENKLGGMSAPMKRRYLLGMWEHIDGSGFFDADGLTRLHEHSIEHPVLLKGEPAGDVTGASDERPKLVEKGNGRLEVYAAPVRLHTEPDGTEVKAHRYVVAVDSSSGASADYSAVQVVDVDEMEQVAEWQGKVDTDQLADIAFLIACVYNGALIAVEVTGGWGTNAALRVLKLIGGWKGPDHARPKTYTRRRLGRLSEKFTDLVGFDTQTATRALALGALEETVREGALLIHGQRTLAEMSAFSFPERAGGLIDYRKPQARSGDHDDLVMALAIGVYIAVKQPSQSRQLPRRESEPVAFTAAGM